MEKSNASVIITNHVDNEDVANAANEDDEAEHDWDEVLGDDRDVLLLFLREGHVSRQACLWNGKLS